VKHDTTSSVVPAQFAKYVAAAVWMPHTACKPWEGNPNKGDVEKVAASLERFGFIAPICVWTSKNRMVAGHTRLAAFRLLLERDAGFVPHGAPGPGLVPVRFHEFRNEAEAEAYALADNQLERLATSDDVKLAAALARIKAADATILPVIGFSDPELEAIRARARAASGGEGGNGADPDDVPDPPKNPRTKRGDVWSLGAHRLICGDCREAADVAMLFGKLCANIAFTSPPYASQRKYDEASGFKPIAPGEFVEWFDRVQANVRAHLAANGSWFVNIKAGAECGSRLLYVIDLTLAHVRSWEWSFIDEFCWRNTRNGTPGSWPNRFKNAWEPVFHFAQAPALKFRPRAVAKESDITFRYEKSNGTSPTNGTLLGKEHGSGHGLARPSNVLEIAPSSESAHGAAFPVALPEFFIHAFTDEGDVVFDPFMGSGSTLIACERTGRVGLGVEISPAYCDVVVARWEKFTGKTATRSSGSKVDTQQSGNSPPLASPTRAKTRGKQAKTNGGADEAARRKGGKAPRSSRAA
jgi:DNA modification methylase